MQEGLYIIAVLGFFLFVAWRRKNSGDGHDNDAYKTKPYDKAILQNYAKVPSLFVNRSETTFFQMLSDKLPNGYHVFAKVRLEDIIRVSPEFRQQSTSRVVWNLRGRIKSRHVDFLIVKRQGHPKAAIELDGSSHNSDTAIADSFKTGIFAASDLKLYRVKVGQNFASHIKKIISNL